jgi:nucleoside-diphosphate-sugar epimerase
MLRVLITGSSGQIGTNVGLALLKRGDQVAGVDIRPNTWTDAIPTRILDLSQAAPEQIGDGPVDVVVHLAAYAKVFELVEHPERAFANIRMIYPVLEYCRRYEIPVLFGSSREVYGDIQHHITDETAADFVVAESPYSASKIAGEAMIYSYGECYGLPYLVYRFSNVYGRFDNDLERMERVIPLFIRKVSRDEPIVVYGREKVLDFTYVDDAVSGVLLGIDALVAARVRNQTFNLSYGQGNTLVDVVNIVSLALGRKARVRYEPARPGEIMRYVGDISKARQRLGYQPRVPLSEGLPRTIEWWRECGQL